MGITHLREGRVDLAIDAIKQAIKVDPKNAFFYKGLGTAYPAKQKWNDAIDAYRKALELNPYFVDVRNDLGTALILSGKRDEGKKEFLTLFSDPTNPTPEMTARNLGQCYLEEKNYAGGPQLVPLVHHPGQELSGPLPGRGRRAPRAWASSRRPSRPWKPRSARWRTTPRSTWPWATST